jgi:hypothetical protein
MYVTAKKAVAEALYTTRYRRVLALKQSAVRQLRVGGCGAAAAQLESGAEIPGHLGAGDNDDERVSLNGIWRSGHWVPATAADQGGDWVEPSSFFGPLFNGDDDGGGGGWR